MRIDPLLQFCKQIGVESDAVKDAERLETFYLEVEFPAKRIKDILRTKEFENNTLITRIEKLLENFGDALTLRLSSQGGAALPLIEIKEGECIVEMTKALRRISNLDDEHTLELEVILEKSKLLDQLMLADDKYAGILYFFEKNLLNFLRLPLLALEEHLFSDIYRPTIVVVLENNLYCSGPLLTIVGMRELAKAKSNFSLIGKNIKDRVDKYHKTAVDSLNWNGFQFTKLTPLHFLCSPQNMNSTEICKAITINLLHLCILYTANRSDYEAKDKRFKAFFSSSERTVSLSLEMELTTNEMQELLPQLVIWPYGGKDNDRLTIFQTVVTRKLESEDPKKNYTDFCNHLQQLLKDVRWHHKLFIEGRIDKHFEQVQKVTDYVAIVVNDVSQTFESVTKGFTDTLLASVGVIVLTMLTSLIKEETQGTIFKVAMWAYAAYLFMFQGLYRLGSIWHSFHLLQKGTDERLAVYEDKLGKGLLDKLILPLTRKKKQFLFWFFLTVFVYAVVIILILILGNFVPQYLKQISSVN